MYVPERMKGMARPIEYMTSKNIPFISVVSSDANASTEPKIGPIHGDQPNQIQCQPIATCMVL